MKPFILDADGKPCIWPVPMECIWNGDFFKIKAILKITACKNFGPEIETLLPLFEAASCKAEITDGEADFYIYKCSDEGIGEEGYLLQITDRRIALQAQTEKGTFYGLQTLLQIIRNTPGPYIAGADVVDRPRKATREVHAVLPDRDRIDWFKGWIDFLAGYKINRLVIDSGTGGREGFTAGTDEMEELSGYLAQRHIEIKESKAVFKDRGGFDVNEIRNVLKSACILWWTGYKEELTTPVDLIPDYLEKIVAQLYPPERNRLKRIQSPARDGGSFIPLEIRKFYNAPLKRTSWLEDDFDFSFLADAKRLPNTTSFSLFQGVGDLRTDNALILAGNGFNRGIYGIPVNMKLKSLVFLHSYIIENEKLQNTVAGNYIIHYKGGRRETVEITYGSTIHPYKTASGSDIGSSLADPAFTVVTKYQGLHMVASQEWINPAEELEVEKIDIIYGLEAEDGGMAVFGITAVL